MAAADDPNVCCAQVLVVLDWACSLVDGSDLHRCRWTLRLRDRGPPCPCLPLTICLQAIDNAQWPSTAGYVCGAEWKPSSDGISELMPKVSYSAKAVGKEAGSVPIIKEELDQLDLLGEVDEGTWTYLGQLLQAMGQSNGSILTDSELAAAAKGISLEAGKEAMEALAHEQEVKPQLLQIREHYERMGIS